MPTPGSIHISGTSIKFTTLLLCPLVELGCALPASGTVPGPVTVSSSDPTLQALCSSFHVVSIIVGLDEVLIRRSLLVA